jgi:TatD DNase family protein
MNPTTPLLIDSHCHLHTIDLAQFDQSIENLLKTAEENGVYHMLCVCIELEDLPAIQKLAEQYNNISTSAGIHPNVEVIEVIPANKLIELAAHRSCIAIGETGLDYFRTETEEAKKNQCLQFREHIRAAVQSSKPLIIHTRDAAEDTLLLMKEEKADVIGGVMHCFTESWDVARRALDLNFYISFSGILTFKNAVQLQEVAKKVPLDRILIETDSPYLAPIPFRGKQNHPALVKHVAERLCELRQVPFAKIAEVTSENFYRCFNFRPVA